jgi:hypothetical protein
VTRSNKSASARKPARFPPNAPIDPLRREAFLSIRSASFRRSRVLHPAFRCRVGTSSAGSAIRA